MSYRLEYSETGKDADRELWASYVGTKKETRIVAAGLWVSLREQSCKKPAVWVAGKRIRQPSIEDINQALGEVFKTWEDFNTYLTEVQQEMSNSDNSDDPKPEKNEAKYERIECRWCDESIPKNGAAQFSHLKKHVNELKKKGLLTEDQASSVRKLKLEQEIEDVFKSGFKRE